MLKKWESRFFWITFAITAITGFDLIIFRDFQAGLLGSTATGKDSPLLQPYIKLHILAAAFFLLSFGFLIARHVIPYFKRRKTPGLKTGITMLIFTAPMILTGYLLQMIYEPTWHLGIWWVHSISSILFVIVFYVHQAFTHSQSKFRLLIWILFTTSLVLIPVFLAPEKKISLDDLPEEIDLSDIDLNSSSRTSILRSFHAMGTYLTIESNSAEVDYSVADKIFNRIKSIEQTASTYLPESEISKINQSAGTIKLSSEMFELLQTSLYFYEITKGAFHPALLARMQKAGFRESKSHLNIFTSLDMVVLNQNHKTLEHKPIELKFDLGGIGKGYALEIVRKEFRLDSSVCTRISFGGQWLITGKQCNREVQIKHPLRDEVIGTMYPKVNGSIATSSSGEKFKFTGKKRVSHIFDTSQNQFRSGLFSVSVFHSDAIAADALSTAIAARPSLAPEIVLTDPEIIIVILDEDTISSFSRKNSFISEYKKSSNRS